MPSETEASEPLRQQDSWHESSLAQTQCFTGMEYSTIHLHMYERGGVTRRLPKAL